MARREELGTTSYLVLGLAAWRGPLTVYQMKRVVEGSIGNFWSFPHTSLYSETARLVEAGLLDERREGEGRRRRLFTVTETGRDALLDWLNQPAAPPPEIRYPALLKLFFAGLAPPESTVDLAGEQVEAHAGRVRQLEEIEEELFDRHDLAHQLETLRLGIAMERAALDFWRSVAVEPPVSTDQVDESGGAAT
jgi:PadR family transcriptional regulator, regulatory protein AphA